MEDLKKKRQHAKIEIDNGNEVEEQLLEEEDKEEDVNRNHTSAVGAGAANQTTTDTTGENSTVPTNSSVASTLPEASTVPLVNSTASVAVSEESLPVERPARYVLLGKPPSFSHPHSMMMMSSNPSSPSPSQPFVRPHMDNHQLILAGVSGAVAALGRLWLVIWLVKRLTEEDELVSPRQHFRWECLNDRYSRDETVFQRVMATPSRGFSRLQWSKYLKRQRPRPRTPKKGKEAPLPIRGPTIPSRNVIVVDITPSGKIDMEYITDVVNFLVAAHSKMQLGETPEIVCLLESPGGGVSKFGLAAAQVGRLKQQTGLNVTICVDDMAGSGGYMIASQATTLIGAPFAILGSIGVIVEGLNINKLLTKYGVQPIIVKAGESKNRISQFGEVTDADLKDETKRLESIHQAFIDMCLKERPGLDPSICDGTVMVASEGFHHGLVDRVLTSEEYIWECIQEGAHVLKLRRATDVHPNFALFQALNVLPHLKQKLRKWETGKLLSFAVQGVALVQMILKSLR